MCASDVQSRKDRLDTLMLKVLPKLICVKPTTLPVIPIASHDRKGGMLQVKTMARTPSGQVVVGIVNSRCIRVGRKNK